MSEATLQRFKELEDRIKELEDINNAQVERIKWVNDFPSPIDK